MEHYAAIDVSLEWSSVCVVDAAGQIVREAKVRSEREALVAFFAQSGVGFARIMRWLCGHVSGLLTRSSHDRWPRWVPRAGPHHLVGLRALP